MDSFLSSLEYDLEVDGGHICAFVAGKARPRGFETTRQKLNSKNEHWASKTVKAGKARPCGSETTRQTLKQWKWTLSKPKREGFSKFEFYYYWYFVWNSDLQRKKKVARSKKLLDRIPDHSSIWRESHCETAKEWGVKDFYCVEEGRMTLENYPESWVKNSNTNEKLSDRGTTVMFSREFLKFRKNPIIIFGTSATIPHGHAEKSTFNRSSFIW